MKFELDGKNKRVYDVLYIPTITHYSAGYQNHIIYPLDIYTPEIAGQHGILAFDRRFSIDYMNELINSTIDEKFR